MSANGTEKRPAAKRAGQGKKKEAPSGPERLYEFADEVAAQTAGEEAEERERAVIETWVTFTLAGEHFAVPAMAIQEILRVSDITRVPHAPYTVRGIINMRGRAVPVIDLRTRLGLGRVEVGHRTRILVTNTRGRLLGLLVDSAEKVVGLDRSAVEPAPPDVMTGQSEYIVGVQRHEEQLVILLDVAKVLLLPDSLEAVNAAREGDGL